MYMYMYISISRYLDISRSIYLDLYPHSTHLSYCIYRFIYATRPAVTPNVRHGDPGSPAGISTAPLR